MRFQRLFFFSIITGALAAPLTADEYLQQVTQTAFNESQPVESSDGRYLVYVTNREANGDLEVLDLTEDKPRSPELISPSRTKEWNPIFSPDDRYLLFFSSRDDASIGRGEAYLKTFPNGDVTRLTNNRKSEEFMGWQKNGNDWNLVFKTLTFLGVQQYEIFTTNGQVVGEYSQLPANLITQNNSYELRYLDDTNGDELIDAQDAPSIWRPLLKSPNQFIQISPPIQNLSGVTFGAENRYVVLSRNNNSDIFEQVKRYPAESFNTADEGLSLFQELSSRIGANPFDALSVARNLILYFPDNQQAREASVDILESFANKKNWVQVKSDAAWFADQLTNDSLEKEKIQFLGNVASVILDSRINDDVIKSDVSDFSRYYQGVALASRGQSQDALSLFTALISSDSTAPKYEYLARLQAAQLFGDVTTLGIQLLDGIDEQTILKFDPDFNIYRIWTDLVVKNISSNADKIEAISTAKAQTDSALLQNYLQYREAQLLLNSGNPNQAREALELLVPSSDLPLEYELFLFSQVANLYQQMGDRDSAFSTYNQLFEILPATQRPELEFALQELVDAYEREILFKGNEALRLSDPRLARAIFTDFVERIPDSVEGWRGLLEAEYRLGLITNSRVSKFRKEAKRRETDSLEWYKAGLAASYLESKQSDAKKYLLNAIAINGSVPFYYQTYAYVIEQQARKKDDRELLVSALDLYEQALSLLDSESNPLAYGRLLQNTGLVAFEIQNDSLALNKLKERMELGVPFDDPRGEFLTLRALGISSFRQLRLDESVEYFTTALNMVDGLRSKDLIDDETQSTVKIELLDRLALTELRRKNYQLASDLFVDVSEQAKPSTTSQVRGLRNAGLAFFELAKTQTSTARYESAEASRELLVKALEILRSSNFKEDEKPKSSGLFSFGLSIASNLQSSTVLDFTKEDEERLLSISIARLDTIFYPPDQARASLNSIPFTQPTDKILASLQDALAQAVIYDEQASLALREGDVEETLNYLVQGFQVSRYGTEEEPIIIIESATHFLIRISETLLSNPSIQSAKLSELFASSEPNRVQEQKLERLIGNFISELSADPLFATDQRSALQLQRALLLEKLSLSQPSLNASASRLRALIIADQIIDNGFLPEALAQEKQWMLYAYGLKIRLLSDYPDEQNDATQLAVQFAAENGFQSFEWWLRAQAVDHFDQAKWEELRLSLAKSLPSSQSPTLVSGTDYLRPLVLNAIHQSLQADDFRSAFLWAETYRHYQLRHRFADFPLTENPLDQQSTDWVRNFKRLQAQYNRQLNTLQSYPALSVSQEATKRYQDLSNLLLDEINDGVSAGIPAAFVFAPVEIDGDNPATILSDFSVSDESIAVVILTDQETVVYPAGEDPFTLSVPNDQQQALNKYTKKLLINLSSDPVSTSDDEISIYSLSTTLLAKSQFPLNTTDGYSTINLDELKPSQSLEKEFDQQAISLSGDINTNADNPRQWYFSGFPMELMTNQFSSVKKLQLSNEPTRTGELSGYLSTSGLAEINTPQGRWLGELIDPRQAPEIAEAELDAELSRIISLLNEGRNRRAILPTKRLYQLRKLIESPFSDIAEAGRLLAQLYNDSGSPENSIVVIQELIELDGRQEPASIATLNQLLGRYANESKEWDLAFNAFEKAASSFSSMGENASVIEMKMNQAIILENQGRVNDALSQYDDLLQLLDAQNDIETIYTIHRNRGRILDRQLSRYADALTAYENALAVAEQIGDQPTILSARLNKARVQERLGAISIAAKTTAEVLQQARDIESLNSELEALLLSTYLAWIQADYLNAFKFQAEAEQLANRLGDQPYLLVTLNDKGLIRWSLNQNKRALAELNIAVDLAKEQFFEQELSSTYNNRSLVYRSTGQFDLALEDLRTTLDIDQRTNNLWGQGYALRNIGQTLQMMGNAAEAEKVLLQALGIVTDIGDRVNTAKTELALGETYLDLGNFDQAQKYFSSAEQNSRELFLREVQWRAIYGQYQIEKAQTTGLPSKDRLLQAIEIVENLRASLRIEELQEGFILDKQVLYDELVALNFDEGNIQAAFESSERSRSRFFIDLLGNQKVALFEGASDEILERDELLRSTIEILEKQSTSDNASVDLERVNRQLDAARQDYQDFLLQLRIQNPKLNDFVSVNVTPVSEVQSLLDQNVCLISYHVTADRMFVFLVTSDSILGWSSDVNLSLLRTRIETLRSRIQSKANLEPVLSFLSTDLFGAVQNSIPENAIIGIIPHRELHLVPFSALKMNGQPIVDQHALFNSTSASVLSYTMKREKSDSQKVLAIGNPDLNSTAFNLPMAEKEANRMAWTFPDADILTGNRATESWLRENISKYGIIHLAMHGEYEPEIPLLSALQLSPDDLNDGNLTAKEIFDLKLNADLVALSACQTGLGRITAGDEVIGLNRSFVYAGTRQLLSTLWRVDDVETAVLVKHFYRGNDTYNRAEALRQAQLVVRDRNPHPAYWAGMTLSGDWR